MLRFVRYLLLLQLTLYPCLVHGQLVQRLRARRAAGQTPLIDRALNLARRLQGHEDLAPAPEAEPTPAEQQTNAAAQDSASQRTATRRPEILYQPIDSLDMAGLQQEIVRSHALLQADLSRFSSARSWQGFLAVPQSLAASGAVNPQTVDSLVGRYERVADNPKFSQVSSLRSFDRTRALLQAYSTRLEQTTDSEDLSGPLLGNAMGTRNVDESVAAASFEDTPPAKPVRPVATPDRPASQPILSHQSGERSILVRRN